MLRRVLFVMGLVATCWWGMMLVHEGGHVVAGVGSGGRVVRVEWPVVGFSRTEVSGGRHPVVVIWGGPVVGAGVPLGVAMGLRALRRGRRWATVEIFSGFCLVANGVYLAAGSVGRIGDAGDLLRHGVAGWMLWAVGVPLAVAGVVQWHGLGRRMGVGEVGKREAAVTVVVGAGLVGASFIWQCYLS